MEISRHVRDLVTPLCDATVRLLQEIKNLHDHDRALISLDEKYDARRQQFIKRIYTTRLRRVDPTDGHVYDASYRMRGGWWHRVPGADVLSGSYGFQAPATDITALTVLAALGPDRLDFEDETAKMDFWTSAMRFAKQAKVARAQAGFKQFKSIPNAAPKGTDRHQPMRHQAVATYCAARSEAYALWMEQSTGKTYSTILTIEEAHEPGKCQMAVIVCPKNLRLNWTNEIREFSTLRTYVVRLKGGDLDRSNQLLDAFRARLSGDYDIVYVLVSYQSFVNSQVAVCAYPWDWGILEEAHFIKTPYRQRTNACLRLRDSCKRRLELTGTPITNHAFDLFTQFEFLGEGWSGFNTFDDFKNFYGVFEPIGHGFEPIGHGVERIVSLQNVPLLQERITRMGFTISKKEALPDLPDKSYEIIGVEMTPTQAAIYDALANQLYAEIESDLASGDKTVTVNNVLTRLLRLAQITSGFVALDQAVDPETAELLPRQIDRLDPNPKLEEYIDFVKQLHVESPQSKMITWCCFVQDIRTIAARLRAEGFQCVTYYGQTSDEDRAQAEYLFNNDPNVNHFIGNPTAGGVGLNLMGAGCWPMRTDVVGFYSQGWQTTARSQGEERPRGYLHESVSPTGKREHWQIRCVDFCVEDTIDELIRRRVTDKRRNAAQLQDVRELLSNLIRR